MLQLISTVANMDHEHGARSAQTLCFWPEQNVLLFEYTVAIGWSVHSKGRDVFRNGANNFRLKKTIIIIFSPQIHNIRFYKCSSLNAVQSFNWKGPDHWSQFD